MKKSNGTTEQTVTNFNLTKNEVIFLVAMTKSDFWENGINSIPWDYSVLEILPFKGKTASGVVSSLVQKGVIGVSKKEKGDIAGTFWLTDEAKASEEILSIINQATEPKVEEPKKEEPKKEEKKTTKKSEPKTEEQLTAIEKVRKLMQFSKENGATEGEIENAVKAAQRLMKKHNLDNKDIEMSSNDINVTEVEGTWKDGMEAKSFELQLLILLTKENGCKVVNFSKPAFNKFKVIGLAEDREIVIELFNTLVPVIRNLTKTRFKESDKTLSQFKFTTSYQSGFLTGLYMKLQEDKKVGFKVSESKQYELIIVKKDALAEEFMNTKLDIVKKKIKQPELDADAYGKGVEDGSEKNLNKQLGN